MLRDAHENRNYSPPSIQKTQQKAQKVLDRIFPEEFSRSEAGHVTSSDAACRCLLAAMDSNISTIYIELVNEGTFALRPTTGQKISGQRFKVLSTRVYDPELEKWQFPPPWNRRRLRMERAWRRENFGSKKVALEDNQPNPKGIL